MGLPPGFESDPTERISSRAAREIIKMIEEQKDEVARMIIASVGGLNIQHAQIDTHHVETFVRKAATLEKKQLLETLRTEGARFNSRIFDESFDRLINLAKQE